MPELPTCGNHSDDIWCIKCPVEQAPEEYGYLSAENHVGRFEPREVAMDRMEDDYIRTRIGE